MTTSLFPHEAKALELIQGQTKTKGLGEALNNLEIHDPQTNRYLEADLVIIGHNGIYLVELKHWSGRVEVRPDSWLRNNSTYVQDPHKTNNFKAKLLKGIYERKFPSYPNVFIESVVVLTNPAAESFGCASPRTNSHNPTFESIDHFVHYLVNQRKSGQDQLSKSQCQSFAAHLRALSVPDCRQNFTFEGYETVETLYQYEDRAEVIARKSGLRRKKLSRLRVFFPKNPVEREKATGTLNAVEKIGDHPNVLKVWDIPNDYNYLVEGSDWSETGTLRDFITENRPILWTRAIAIAIGLTRGLKAAHEELIIHRAVMPENILLVNDVPKIMNFDLSFQLEEGRVTVIPEARNLKRNAYTAPEVYELDGHLDEAADLFSVGVILYEMLAGERPFQWSGDLQKWQGKLGPDHLKKLTKLEVVPHRIVELIQRLVQANPRDRLSDASQVIEELEGNEKIGRTEPIAKINSRLPPGHLLDLYQIENFYCEGAEAQIYRVKGPQGRCLALKLFNLDVQLSRIVDENELSGAVIHGNLVRRNNFGQVPDGRKFITFDWVSERNLRNDIVDGIRPSPEIFMRGAQQLMEAIRCLHQHTTDGATSPILHNDIKPENILIGQGPRLVLIDFGCASSPHVGTYEGTTGYVPTDLMAGQDRNYTADGDLYALCVTLHEWLLGCRPGEFQNSLPDELTSLVGWLALGCQTDSEHRYSTVDKMFVALEAVSRGEHKKSSEEKNVSSSEGDTKLLAGDSIPSENEPKPPTTESNLKGPNFPRDPNPFVPYLNSLHSRNGGNENALAESQARNSQFPHIQVSHPVASLITQTLSEALKKHVILTGHAGDGKSTIALEVYKQLKGLNWEVPLEKSLRRREDVGPVSLIKDFSEWTLVERAELMREMLGEEEKRFFLVSNTGTLLDAFKAAHEVQDGTDWAGVESQLLSNMDAKEPITMRFEDTAFVMINVAMMENLSIARQIFGRMLAKERWDACEDAPCRTHCPIYKNVSLMRANLPIIQERIFLVYRRLYEYGIRLTLRQLGAHLAYTITSGLDFSDIIKIGDRPVPTRTGEFLFFNRFFGDDGRAPDKPALKLRGIREVRAQNLGNQPCPSWERRFWLKTEGQGFRLQAMKLPDDFDSLRKCGSGVPMDGNTDSRDAREQFRRAVFFLHDFEIEQDDAKTRFLASFLHSRMLLDFVRWQNDESPNLGLQEEKSLHRRVLHVLQEHFTGIRLPEGRSSDSHLFITLSRKSHDVRQSAQIVLARWAKDEFRIRLMQRKNVTGGYRRELALDGPSTTTARLTLPLSLPFLDYVMLRHQGEVGQGLKGSYIDRLERFKGLLIHGTAAGHGDEIMLVRLQTNHTFKKQIFSINNGKLEVIDA